MANKNGNGARVIGLSFKKETAGTYVYQEDVSEDGTAPVMRTAYVAKWALGRTAPTAIKVTIEAA